MAVQAGGQRMAAQAGEGRGWRVAQAGEQRVAVQAGGQRMAAQAGEGRGWRV